MRYGLLLLILTLSLYANEANITKEHNQTLSMQEYGKLLYNSPHGISCAKCHGKKGEGKRIAKYKEDGVSKELKGADLRTKGLKDFEVILQKEYHPIMPRYFLTQEEIEAIYSYIVKN